MRTMASFLKRTAIGGLLFLLPIGLIIFLLGHLVVLIRPIAVEVADFLGQARIGPFWLFVAVLVTLVLIAFLAGLAATTVIGRKLRERIETLVLNQIPGYAVIRNAAAEAARSMAAIDDAEQTPPVLIKAAEGWRLGFVMGAVGAQTRAVYLPNAPSVESGAVVFIGLDRIVPAGITVSEALACLRRLGKGTPALPLPLDVPRP